MLCARGLERRLLDTTRRLSGASDGGLYPSCLRHTGRVEPTRTTGDRPAMSKAHPEPVPRRYLIGFDPRDLPHHFTDVLVVGGGIAGLRAALGIPDRYRVLVVTKDEVRESNSHYAQGGIAGVLDPEDRFDNHIADTIAAGKG